MSQSLDPDDPVVEETIRAAAPAERTARRRWAAGVYVAGLAVAVFGWFVPSMPDVGLVVLGVLALVSLLGLLWLLLTGNWRRRQ